MVNEYYQKYKERLRKEARERHQNLSEEEKTRGKKRPRKDTLKSNFLLISLCVVQYRS